MILPDVIVPEMRHSRSEHSLFAMDHPDRCYDLARFHNFPWPVDYQYNSRGFRGPEWPEDLNSVLWCLGDSFTVGIGSPWSHTWPQRLSQRLNRPTVNVSMDGASNAWLSRKCQQIYQAVQPQNMIIMWSFLHRRELDDPTLTDHQRRLHSTRTTYQQDLENFIDCVASTQEFCKNTKIINAIIPGWRTMGATVITQAKWDQLRGPSWPTAVPKNLLDLKSLAPQVIKELSDAGLSYSALTRQLSVQQLLPLPSNLIEVDQVDLARDGYHFDLLTADLFVQHMAKYFYVDSALCS